MKLLGTVQIVEIFRKLLGEYDNLSDSYFFKARKPLYNIFLL